MNTLNRFLLWSYDHVVKVNLFFIALTTALSIVFGPWAFLTVFVQLSLGILSIRADSRRTRGQFFVQRRTNELVDQVKALLPDYTSWAEQTWAQWERWDNPSNSSYKLSVLPRHGRHVYAIGSAGEELILRGKTLTNSYNGDIVSQDYEGDLCCPRCWLEQRSHCERDAYAKIQALGDCRCGFHAHLDDAIAKWEAQGEANRLARQAGMPELVQPISAPEPKPSIDDEEHEENVEEVIEALLGKSESDLMFKRLEFAQREMDYWHRMEDMS